MNTKKGLCILFGIGFILLAISNANAQNLVIEPSQINAIIPCLNFENCEYKQVLTTNIDINSCQSQKFECTLINPQKLLVTKTMLGNTLILDENENIWIIANNGEQKSVATKILAINLGYSINKIPVLIITTSIIIIALIVYEVKK